MKKEMLEIFDLQKTIFSYIFVDFGHDIFFLYLYHFFRNQYQLAYSHQQTITTNNWNYSSKNELSNALLKQFKEIVFKQLSSNSSSLVPIVVGIVTTNGTQVSG